MTGFAYGPELLEPLSPVQEQRLTEILVSVGLSESQADQIVRRMNESTTPL